VGTRGSSSRGVAIHVHIVLRLRMSGVIPLLPL